MHNFPTTARMMNLHQVYLYLSVNLLGVDHCLRSENQGFCANVEESSSLDCSKKVTSSCVTRRHCRQCAPFSLVYLVKTLVIVFASVATLPKKFVLWTSMCCPCILKSSFSSLSASRLAKMACSSFHSVDLCW